MSLFQVKIELIKKHIQKFNFFDFFSFLMRLTFLSKFPKIPRKISAAILEILDFKILNKNIQRFIAFDLIYHLVYFLMVRELQTLQKIC